MALYSYEAFTKEGKKVTGVIDASSPSAVRQQLTQKELYPISIYLASDETQMSFFKRLTQGSVSLKEKILFTKQLAVLLKSGIPLLSALELLIDQFKGRLHSILITIKDEVKGGRSFADMLSRYPSVFDSIYVQLVRAGEASGKLEEILVRLTEFLERRDTIQKRIRGAMQYPIVQMVVIVGVVGLLLVVVVPQLQGLFDALKNNLPASTRILLSSSNFVKNHVILLLISIAIPIFLFMYWKSTPSGKRIIDRVKLKIPVVKYISRTNAVVQFCYTLGLLIQSGVNLAEALDIVVKIVDNSLLRTSLMEAREKIIKQGKIAQYLKQSGVFPPIAIHLIRTGEETGELGSMLLTVANNYEADLNELIDRATGLLGPVMLIIMAIVIGFIVMAIAQPIMGAGQAFSAGDFV